LESRDERIKTKGKCIKIKDKKQKRILTGRLILLKLIDSKNPDFGMWSANSELTRKE
jgi:hypothetical protein